MPSQSYWAIIEPAPDLDEVWVAHCLDLDLVTQGKSPEHATEMIHEAIDIVLQESPMWSHASSERRAPDVYWDRLKMLIAHGSGQGARAVQLKLTR